MGFANRLWRIGATRRWVVLAVMLLGVATVQAGPATRAAADASPRYLNLHQCVYSVRTPLDTYTTVLRSSAGGTNVRDIPETGVNCLPNVEGGSLIPYASGVVALDLNAGRYLNLHQCAYYSTFYHEWFTTLLPSSVGGTNVGNVPESEVKCPPSSPWGGVLIAGQSAVVALDLTAGRYLNLGQCVYRTAEPDLFTTYLPWSIAGANGGTNISNTPDAAVNCQSPGGTVVSLPSLSGVIALDLQTPALSGVVPNVVDWQATKAVAALKAAGFVVQTERGSVDCGPPMVQQQWPVGGTTALLGSTVSIVVSQRPRPPDDDCP